MKSYNSFIDSFGLNLKFYQRAMLNLLYGKKFEKRFTKFSEQYKLITLISRAILLDKSVLGILDANNKITTKDFIRLIELNNIEEAMNYHAEDNKIIFQNGSVIEILKQNENNDPIRGKRANIKPWGYDYESMCDKE